MAVALLCPQELRAQAPPIRSTRYTGANDSRVVYAHRTEYDATTNMTIEAWVYLGNPNAPTYAGRFHTILSHNWMQSFWFGVTPENRLRFYRSGGIGMFRDSTNPVPPQRWTHVAASYDGSRVRFYIDGAPAGDQPLGNAGINKTQQLVLGNDVNGGLGLLGYLDEVRLWSVARSPAEIAENRFQEIESAPGLVARFPDGRESTTPGVVGTASNVTSEKWGVLPRNLVAPRSPLAVNYDQNLDEFVNAGAERIIWRYRTPAGAERDGEGYLLYRDELGDRNLYVVVPYTSGGTALEINSLQPLWFSFMFAPGPFEGPPPTAPQTNHYRIDARVDFSSPVAPQLRRGNGTSWTTVSSPAPGSGSWEVRTVTGCEFDCPRIFRIPVSLLGAFTNQPKPILWGEFAYAAVGGLLSPYSLPSPFDGEPNNPSTWPLLFLGGTAAAFTEVRFNLVLTNVTPANVVPPFNTPEGNQRVSLDNPRNGTVFFAYLPLARNGQEIEFRTAIYPTNAPLRLTVHEPTGPGLWRNLDPSVLRPPGHPNVRVLVTDRFQGVIYTNLGLPAGSVHNLGTVVFPFIQHRSPVLSDVSTRTGLPRVVVRTSPRRTTAPTRFTVFGTNLHPFCRYYLSHVNGTAPINPGDPLPSGASVTNFPLRVVEHAADWTSATLELDFELDARLNEPRESWLAGPYRILLRDEWGGVWRRLDVGFRFDAYAELYGFPFDNERDGTQFDEFSNVYRWNAYDCVTLIGPLPGANPCFGCRVPNPLYVAFYSLVFTPWVELMTGSCLGMSATSLMFRNGDLRPEAFEAPARYSAGFSTRPRVFRDEHGNITGSDELGPPKPQEHRFRVCDYSEPVNLWAHIHRNQAMQVTAEFLGSVLSQMDGTGIVPLGGSGYSIAGNPVRAMDQIRGRGFRGHILAFQDGADVLKSHAVVAYAAEDEVGLDAETALSRVPAPGKTVLRIYDPNHPVDPNRLFEINRTANTYRYRWGVRRVVEGSVTNWVPDIWSGKGVYAVPLDIFRNAGTMPGADLLVRGLALLLFGAADGEYVDRDGGRWGYDAAGRIVESYPGGRAIAPFGISPEVPTYTGRTAWFFPPTNRPPSEIRVRVRPQPDGTFPSNTYRFYAGGGGTMMHLQADEVPTGSLDRLRLTAPDGLLRGLRLEPGGARTKLEMTLGLMRPSGPSLALQWSGLQAGAGENLGWEALPDNSGALLRNATGRNQNFQLRLYRSGANPEQQPADSDVFGPFQLPPGGVQQVDLPDSSLRRLRIGLDLNGDGLLEQFAVLGPAGGPPAAPPTLRAGLAPGGRVRLTWPVSAETWVLESASQMGPGAVWQPVNNVPAVAADQVEVEINAGETQRWFRLRRAP
jgi:hypothetical protein